MKYQTIFIVDPVRGERIQLAKFLMAEFFTILGFVAINDCFKRTGQITCKLIIYVLRRNKTEIKHLLNIKKKYKNMNFVLLITPDSPDVDLTELKEQGFSSVLKANSQEKVREITMEMLAPDGLPPRTEVPHPVPVNIKNLGILQSTKE